MADETGNILKLTKADIRPAAETLAKAFEDYPESVYLMPDTEKRHAYQLRMYRTLLKGALTYGEVWATSTKMEGVAVWQRIDGKSPAWGRYSFLRWWWLSLFSDKGTKKRQREYFGYLGEFRARVAPERYWYLQVLGVNPVFQGQGFSSRLLKPMLVRSDGEQLSIYLETQLENNIPYYEHFGFKIAAESPMPGGNIKSWAMVRYPVKTG